MDENTQYNNPDQTNEQDSKRNISRRDVLKGLATLPVVGAFAYGVWKKKQRDHYLKSNLLEELKIDYKTPPLPKLKVQPQDKPLRLGFIGIGSRGSHLLRAAGFAHPSWIEEAKAEPEGSWMRGSLETYLTQYDLNVTVNGVCDVFDPRAQEAIEAVKAAGQEKEPTRYRTYKELLASPEIDAVVVATPDHWHAKIIIDAAYAGKHVYVEKAMTRTEDETYRVVEAVNKNGIVFQLGHQGRQNESYLKAREAIKNDVLGKITLVETSTNRNNPNGAWVYDIDERANEQTIDWKQFLGDAPYIPFNKEHFFRWRCWWEYGTGLSGDLLTHEYDAVNQVLGLGIPHSAVCNGGIYYFKDGRTVPDVMQAVFEYPDRDMTLLYSATLASGNHRPKLIMGHDATMELTAHLVINADRQSTKYKEAIEAGKINPSQPIFHYIPGAKEVDAVTSATSQYFASKGLMGTYRGDKRVDTTHLHIKEWLDCIRNPELTPSCNIDRGFEEAITAHMATISYREGVKTYWDADKKRIVRGERQKVEGETPSDETLAEENGEMQNS